MHLPAPGGPKIERASLGSHQSAPRHRARFTLGQPRGKGLASRPPEGEQPWGGRRASGELPYGLLLLLLLLLLSPPPLLLLRLRARLQP